MAALPVDWNEVDTVLLDMDGTLLDRHFDDYFWETHVPEIYARIHNLSLLDSRKLLLARYRGHEGTLDWTDLDFWSEQLGLDIPQLKAKMEHLIAVHPYVIDFLDFVRGAGKGVYLVTNAHSKTLHIKMRKTELGPYFHRVVCSQEVGVAKEDPRFWEYLRRIIDYVPERTMLADDTEAVLDSARVGGLGHLIHVARPSSTAPERSSDRFVSIRYFSQLIPGQHG
ncbi:MAG: HAD family hydrolase [Thermodesulfobacteriota bacterium]